MKNNFSCSHRMYNQTLIRLIFPYIVLLNAQCAIMLSSYPTCTCEINYHFSPQFKEVQKPLIHNEVNITIIIMNKLVQRNFLLQGHFLVCPHPEKKAGLVANVDCLCKTLVLCHCFFSFQCV